MKNLIAVAILILASSCGTLANRSALTFNPEHLTGALVAKALDESQRAGAIAAEHHDDRGLQCFSDASIWFRLYPAYDETSPCLLCQLEHKRLFRLWLSSPEHENADVSCRTFLTDKGSLLGWVLRGLH